LHEIPVIFFCKQFITEILVLDRMEEQKKQVLENNTTLNLSQPHKKIKSIVKHSMSHTLSDMDTSSDLSDLPPGT
jgi:hypothetical protein